MKKIYIKPTVETIYISTQHIIAASLVFDDGNSTGSASLNNDYADGPAMSRGFDPWE